MGLRHTQIASSWYVFMSKKTRLASFGIFFGVFLLACTIGGFYKMSNEESNKFLNEFQSATAGIEAPGIFIHNISEALPMFIPAFGVAWGSFTAWSTGAAFGALIAKNSQLSSLPPATLFLFSPFGALEVIAYSIAMSRSYILVWRIIKKNPLKKEIRNTAIEIGTVAVILLVAGFVESSIISQSVHHVSLSS